MCKCCVETQGDECPSEAFKEEAEEMEGWTLDVTGCFPMVDLVSALRRGRQLGTAPRTREITHLAEESTKQSLGWPTG